MPTFFPGVQKVTRSRRSSPTPTYRAQHSDKPPSSTRGRKTPSSAKSLSDYRRDGLYSLRDSDAIPTAPEDEDLFGHYSEPAMSPKDSGLDMPRHGSKPDRRAERLPPESATGPSADKHRSPTSLPQSPIVPIYEYCFLLRKHGATVRFTSSSAATVLGQSTFRKASISPIENTGVGVGVDIYNPTAREIRLLDHALSMVLYHGGDVDLPPLTGEQPSSHMGRCSYCFASFSSQREREAHFNGGHNLCSHCQDKFDCQGRLDDHLREFHKIASPDRSNFDFYDTRSESAWRSSLDDKRGI
ncbi:hypothetical protein A1O3_06624 [Capronia epimyces CBS 606.96]|uniref:C2H2-type domain-containing protein n=1 Tax=Capronia epimyces CBS 606.96 TaxID=1182542 RepID=W9YKM5_9EURO|nr:uncharacterized protein A1O3_06624 [Capronia epimyces CBS 606.96]EXJ82809.1 hypothetical protein A1O3_06624 [Capronia epimyces CBS 606.96]